MRRFFVANLCGVCILCALAGGVAARQAADASAVSRQSVAPDANGVYRIGHGVQAPKPISMPDPEFSNEARKKKISGNCRIGLTVDAEGIPQNVHVVRSIAEGQKPKLQKAAASLDQKALETVKQYRFQPAMLDGKPVAVEMMVEVNFQIF